MCLLLNTEHSTPFSTKVEIAIVKIIVKIFTAKEENIMSKQNLTPEQLASLNARQAEVFKRVCNGGLDINDALTGTQAILDKLLPLRQDKFSQFAHLLRPLSDQAENLRNLNKQMPKGKRVPDSWLEALDIASDHVQSIEDLEFFFVVPTGALKKVIEYQVELVKLTQPGIWRSSDFDSEIDDAYLDDTAAKGMYLKPGIYRRRINLVSYWDPKNGSSVDSARKKALASGTLLAGLSAVGAYALQDPELYQKQDGQNLPYFDIAELRSGDGGFEAFCSYWRSDDRRARFGSYGSGYVDQGWAQPSFV